MPSGVALRPAAKQSIRFLVIILSYEIYIIIKYFLKLIFQIKNQILDAILINNKLIQIMYKLYILVLVLLFSLANTEDKGQARLNSLRQLSYRSSNRIIEFSKEDFTKYALSYPRPYDLVIYFTAGSCRLCEDLWPEYEYLAQLYRGVGAIDAEKNPTFFVVMKYSSELMDIFKTFGFNTAPNLVVSKPYMAVVPELQKKQYLQKFKWAISYSDGHVTTHKMLEFVNKRTDRDVIYKPTLITMLTTFFGFISVAAAGVYIYINLKFIWTNWIVWFVGSLLVYITCVSGIIYDILHGVPFVGRDPNTGEALIFAAGNREQYGAEGFVVSFTISLIGILFLSIIIMGQKLDKKYSFTGSVIALIFIYFLVHQLEQIYKSKSWYGPSFTPPEGYLTGPISRDQGNNI